MSHAGTHIRWHSRDASGRCQPGEGPHAEASDKRLDASPEPLPSPHHALTSDSRALAAAAKRPL